MFHVPSWSEEVFVLNEIKNIVFSIYTISDLNGEKVVRTFYEKELQKTNQKELLFKTNYSIVFYKYNPN